jgi:hypothetical protein
MQNLESRSSVVQRVTLPADAVQATLSYQELAMGDVDGVDYRDIWLLDSNFAILAKLDQSNAKGNGQWTQRNFDMTPYLGKTFYLYIDVYNDGSGSQIVSYIDSLALVSCSAWAQ